MIKNVRKSEHIKNYTDIRKSHDNIRFKPKTARINEATAELLSRYVARITHQEIQKMRKAQLSLCKRTGTRDLLPFCQYVRKKPHHDLRFSQESRQGQKSFGKLSSYPQNFGGHQYGQSRSPRPKGDFVKGLCLSQEIHPPLLMVQLFALPICCKTI